MVKQKARSVNAKQTVEDAFRHVLLSNLSAVHKWEPVAVKGKDLEGVHQMRVGFRRMRSAFTVFRPALPRKVTAALAQEMRWAGKTLDHARDLDVYNADNLSSKGGKAQKKVRKIAMRHRKSVYGEVRRFIGGKRYARFNTELARWLDRRAWRKQLSGKQKKYLDAKVTPFAAQVLEQHRVRILKNTRNINKLDADALHQLRIDCKKLRYATEFFSPLYGKSIVKSTEHLEGLQDVLGTVHDVVIMTGLQKGLLKGEHNGKAARFARKLEDQRAKHAKKLRKLLEQRWDDFAQAKPPWKAAAASISSRTRK
jgi:CHAD domain-containing protein